MFEWLYRQVPTALIARRNLTRTQFRSLLAALGIVIGVIAIASLGMFGVSLRVAITQNLGDLGNELVVSPNGDAGVESISDRDIRQIERVTDPATTVSPVKQEIERVSYDRRGTPSQAVVFGMENPSGVYAASEGRIPNPFRNGALVGSALAEEHDLHPGSTIVINGSAVRVRAVLEPGESFSQLNPDSRLIVPANQFETRGYSQVYVTAASGPEANATAMAIRDALNGREERVTVTELGSLIDQINQTFQVVNTILVGIASISLLVAGISILNVMLMSTVERREEIGVLRAVGYQKRDVLKVMLMEAALLGVSGGLIGVVLSVAAGLVINYYTVGDPTALFRLANAWYVGAAFTFGVVTSVLSGLYPAWKAASEEPVEALRG